MATRNFKLIGKTYSEDAACTITLNGAEIFSGALLPETGEELPVCVGSAEVGDDSVEVTLPVVITMIAGSAGFGLFQFNYGLIVNPLLTPEELAYTSPEYSGESSAEVPPEILSSIRSKGGAFVRSVDQYSYGNSEEECRSNRSNVQIDGLPALDPDWNHHCLTDGKVLTFDQFIFARS
jgi:hypothetical protein